MQIWVRKKFSNLKNNTTEFSILNFFYAPDIDSTHSSIDVRRMNKKLLGLDLQNKNQPFD